MKQINNATLMYVDDHNGRLPNISYFCRLFDVSTRNRNIGPYQQDLLGKYTRTKGVWLCPSLKAGMYLPQEPSEPAFLTPVVTDGRTTADLESHTLTLTRITCGFTGYTKEQARL